MEFNINTKTFIKHLTPAADIALKNTVKDHSSEGLIYLAAYMETLTIRACGGSASIRIVLKESDGYEYSNHGTVCIQAKELMDTLKSFPPTEDLVIYTQGDKLRLSPVSDSHDHVGIQLFLDPPELTEPPENYDQEVIVDREYFVKGLKQVEYAPAYEPKMFQYMCILFESIDNVYRFSSGTGGRFAVVEYSGKNQSISSGDAKIIFPKDNVPNIIRILNKAASETIEIKSSIESPEENAPMHIALVVNNLTIYVFGIEHFTQYPDLSTLTTYTFPNQIPIQAQDWKYVTESIKASKHSLSPPIHNAKLVMDIQHGHLDLQINNTQMKMNRRVYFNPKDCIIDTAKDKSYKPWFCCNADYLIEMAKQYKKKKAFTFNFEDQAILDTIPDDMPT